MGGLIGHSGSCKVGTSGSEATVGTAKIWSLDITKDTVDTTTFASAGWKENTPTLSSWSGSITVVFDAGGDAGEANMIANMFAVDGATVSLVLALDDTASVSPTAEKFSGTAIVTSMPITSDVNGVVEVSFNFTGTGALTPAAN